MDGSTPADAKGYIPGPGERLSQWLGDMRRFWLLNNRRRVLLFVLVSTLWLALFANQWTRIDREIAGARQSVVASAETAYIAPVSVLRMVSLGHQGFLADLLFVRVAHYFVQHLITDSQLPWIDLYLDAIWGLDAHNNTTYRWGAQVIKFGQRIDNDVVRRANRFARLGIEAFPNDPWLYHEIAFNLHSHLQTKDAIERTRLRNLALDYLSVAFSMPGFSYDPNFLARQYERAGRIDDSIEAALATYAQATAEERRELRIQLDERNRSAAAQQLSWLEQFEHDDWDYLDPTLALMVGPRRKVAPPLTAWRLENWLPERAVRTAPKDDKAALVPVPIEGILDAGIAFDPAEHQAPRGSITEDIVAPPALTATWTEA